MLKFEKKVRRQKVNVLGEILSNEDEPLKLYAELIFQMTYSKDNQSFPFLKTITEVRK